jgi:hypothetical protein
MEVSSNSFLIAYTIKTGSIKSLNIIMCLQTLMTKSLEVPIIGIIATVAAFSVALLVTAAWFVRFCFRTRTSKIWIHRI